MISNLIKFIGVNHINWFLTLYINFHFLPFKQAIHLPIYVYGWMRFLRINGNIRILSEHIHRGMIKMNKHTTSACSSSTNTEIVLHAGGELTFKGNAFIGSGCKIIANMGAIELGENVRIFNQVTIQSYMKIKIGDKACIAHRSQIMDTNSHAVVDLKTKKVGRTMTPIEIGCYCWIANSSTIMPGVTLPSHTIVASNSLVNKTLDIPQYSILGGIPAKCIGKEKARIWDSDFEGKLHHFFNENPEELYYQYPDEIDNTVIGVGIL